jgi:hypothetical protein
MLAAAALLLVGAFVSDVDTWEESCRSGRGGACYAVGVAAADGAPLRYHDGRSAGGKAIARDPARAARMFRAGCDVDHLLSCAEACADGDDEACGRIEVEARVGAAVRAVRAEGDRARMQQAMAFVDDVAVARTLAWASHDPVLRARALGRLARLTLGSLSAEEREDLRRRLEGEDPTVRREAVLRWPHPAVPEVLVFADPSDLVRDVAASRVRSHVVVRSLARHSHEPEVVRAAVGTVEDRRLLVAIALAIPGPTDARRVALARLTEPEDLEEVAERAPEGAGVGVDAAMRLLDRDRLLRLAESARSDAVKREAIRNLEDPAALVGLARRSPQALVRAEAASRLEATDVLVEIMRAEPDALVRLAAVSRLEDPDLLFHVAQHDPSSKVRVRAVIALQEPQRLSDLAWHAEDAGVRVTAAQMLKDTGLRTAVLRGHPESDVRVAALVHQPLAPGLAAEVARHDHDPRVRLVAARVLAGRGGPEAVALGEALGRESPDPAVRRAMADWQRNLPSERRVDWDARPVAALAYGSDGPVGSIGLIVGELDQSSSHTVPVPDGLTGVLLQGELGRDSVRGAVGITGALLYGPVTAGVAVKATYGHSERWGDEIGGEVELALLARLTAGVAHGPHGTRFTWGVGLGF